MHDPKDKKCPLFGLSHNESDPLIYDGKIGGNHWGSRFATDCTCKNTAEAELRAQLEASQAENKKLREQLTIGHGDTSWIDEYPPIREGIDNE